MSQVGVVGQELGSLQTRMSGEHQQQLDRQRSELTEKDQQLRGRTNLKPWLESSKSQ